MLAGKGYADNRNEKQNPKKYMCDSCPQSAAQYPYDIEQDSEAARIITAAYDLPAKRSQHHSANLKTLNAKRDANNGDAQDQPAYEISQSTDQATKQQPDDIAYEIKEAHYFFFIASIL